MILSSAYRPALAAPIEAHAERRGAPKEWASEEERLAYIDSLPKRYQESIRKATGE